MKIDDDLPQRADGSIDLEAWVKRATHAHTPDQQALLHKAALLSLEHGGLALTPIQESCFRQSLYAAEILLKLQPDIETLAATIAYFPASYGNLSMDAIEISLGPKIREMVVGVLRLTETSSRRSDPDPFPEDKILGQSQRDNIRRMLLAIVEDVRVVLIKLAERVTFLRGASKLEPQEQRYLAQDVRDIYAPLANRLGIGQIKWEMEDLAFRYLEPASYKQIATFLDEKRRDRDAYIDSVVSLIEHSMQEHQLEADVFGRAKHIFSIWRKMQRKGIDFNDVYDVRAIRILVNEIPDAYAALGIIHSLWQYIPKEFDDYIATPKENGYRSLHTAVLGPEGKIVEVQIRTHQMHREAELGVAAHWLYKEGLKHDSSYHSKLASLRQILDWQEEVDDSTDGLRSGGPYAEIFDDRVYVFTPRGDVVDLPKGSTTLDFAYHIHTEIGHRCRGAKVNGAMVALTYTLHSGDQVEVLTAKEPKPSRDWINPHLGYLRTSRAKAKIHQWFRQQDRENNIVAGREIYEREIRRLGTERLDLDSLAPRFNYKKADDVLAAIGRGDLRVPHLVNATQNLPQKTLEPESLITHRPSGAPKGDIQISGVGNLMSHYAKCCKPVPGDPIIGYITLGRGVTVHRKDCLHVLQAEEEREQRLIQVQWGEKAQNVYPVDIGILAYDRQGLLSDITSVLANAQVNVTGVSTHTNPDNSATLLLTLEIGDLNTLGKVLSRILQLPNVLEAYRVREGEAPHGRA